MKMVVALVTAALLAPGVAAKAAEKLDYRKDGRNYLLVLRPGQRVMESLKALAAREGIAGASFTGIGAVRDTEVARYDLAAQKFRTRTFVKPMEVLSLIGNLGRAEGQPVVHAHIVLGDADFQARGGHLNEATVALTLEVFITPTRRPIVRRPNLEFPGAKAIDLEAR